MKEPADKPGSVANSHLSRMYVTTHLKQPTRIHYAGHIGFLFGLAPGGVYLATNGCPLRGALLPHPFTLTGLPEGKRRRSSLCCTGRRLTPPRCYLAPCPMEPGLSSNTVNSVRDCPADSRANNKASASKTQCTQTINNADDGRNENRHRARFAAAALAF